MKFIYSYTDLKWDLFIDYSRHFNLLYDGKNILGAVIMNEVYL